MEGMMESGKVGKWKIERGVWCDHEFSESMHCIVCGWHISNLAANLAQYERMQRTLDLVAAERARQRALLAECLIIDDCSEPAVNDLLKLGVLGEEFGEVAMAANKLQERLRRPGYHARRIAWRREELRKELIQCAAVAVAWAESLEEDPRSKIQDPGKEVAS